MLGRLLVTSDRPEERGRALELLEKLSAPGHYQYDAKTELARAIRKDDPVRARKLLKETRRDDPGGATPPLAEMLIAGEGGPANPEVRVQYPKTVLYYAAEAAELDEPGAMAARIGLKLSQNTQFQDRAGACKLIAMAVSRGDQTMVQRLAECRAN
jgi:hypothetical protein